MLKKPKKFQKKIEIDPLEVFNKVAEKRTKFKINYGNTIHLEYLERRKELINTIESLCILQNSDQETFFQAVFYLDKILFHQKLSEYIDKITNENYGDNFNNESIFFKKFIKTETTKFNNIEDYYRSNELVSRNVIDFDHLFVSLAVGCFNVSNKFIEKIPRLFDENKIRSIQLNYQFNNRDLHNSELFCLEMLDYQLRDLCSFSVLKLILQNGIALDSDKNAQSDLDSKLEKVYENILIMNSMFLVDKRFVDFNPLDIAISLVTYNCELFSLASWKRKVAWVYTRRYKVSTCPCLVVIRSLFSIGNKPMHTQSELVYNEKRINGYNDPNYKNCLDNLESDNLKYHKDNCQFSSKSLLEDKATSNIDYEYYLKLKESCSLQNQINHESNFNFRQISNESNLTNYITNYNNYIFTNSNNSNNNTLNANAGFIDNYCKNIHVPQTAYNYYNYKEPNNLNYSKLINCNNQNLNSSSNVNVAYNYNKKFSIMRLNLNYNRKYKEDNLNTYSTSCKNNFSQNGINHTYLTNINKINCNNQSNFNNPSDNYNRYSSYFFNKAGQINRTQENLKCQNTLSQNTNNNFYSLLSNYYNTSNLPKSTYEIIVNENNLINNNEVAQKINLNNNLDNRKNNDDNYNMNNSESSRKELIIDYHSNIIKEANVEIISSKNSAENSVVNSLVNSGKKDYKDSSDSTKIEESPVNETTDSSICLKEKSDSILFNFFNSVNRKLLESEAVNQSGKKTAK